VTLPQSSQRTIQVVRSTDQRQVRESLREVALLLSPMSPWSAIGRYSSPVPGLVMGGLEAPGVLRTDPPAAGLRRADDARGVAAVAELIGERRMGRRPTQVGAGPGRVGALIEQQDFGKVITEARSSLVLRSRHRSRSAGRNRGSLGEFGDRRIHSVRDDGWPRGVIFQNAPEDLREIRHVHGGPALSSEQLRRLGRDGARIIARIDTSGAG
jgi:hypothetical protein